MNLQEAIEVPPLAARLIRELLLWVGVILLVRLLTLGSPALLETSEGRFGSTALHMLLTGDWITPYIYRGGEVWEPYWAKPPLFVWLAASTLWLFGPYEFGARFPSLLSALAIMLLTWSFARRFFTPTVALIALLTLLTSSTFFFMTGACVTDMMLSATVVAALVSVAHFLAANEMRSKRRWAYTAFASLGLGMMVKGPVAVVLVFATLGLWLLMELAFGRNHFPRLKEVPWIPGGVIFFALWVPWYVAAEIKTPGFLRYYFVQENFMRYVSKDLEIKYGRGHLRPLGTIWLYFIAGLCPVLPFLIWKIRANFRLRLREGYKALRNSTWISFAAAWAVTTILFFTFAKQILFTYVLPALPGAAILFGVALHNLKLHEAPSLSAERPKFPRALALILILISAVGFLYFHSWLQWLAFAGSLLLALFIVQRTTAPASPFSTLLTVTSVVFVAFQVGVGPLITAYRSPLNILSLAVKANQGTPITVGIVATNPRSAAFYADGRFRGALKVRGSLEAADLQGSPPEHLVIEQKTIAELPAEVLAPYEVRAQVADWRYLQRRR